MSDEFTLKHFRSLRETHFDGLCRKLGLIATAADIAADFCRVSGKAGAVQVYFECERGLCSFSVGPASDAHPLCSVEEIAERFPRVRVLGEGSQRLSLDEQCSFLQSRWNDLQVMFSTEHLPETRKWRAAAVAAYTRKFTRK
jgi:hypothetical protein